MKIYLIPFLVFAILLATACSTVPTKPTNDSEVVYAQSDLGRDLEPQIDAQTQERLAQGNSTFAFEFYKQIIQSHENLIFSPLSLSLALSMTSAGAESTTEQEMLQALDLGALGENLHPAFNGLLLALQNSQAETLTESEGDVFQLHIANSIWAQSGADFETVFMDTLARSYGAGIYKVNYEQAPEAARGAINNWVADETEEKIINLIPEGAIDSLTRLVLANAIYFNGSWFHPFEEADTSEAPFTKLDGSQVSVDMMHLPQGQLQFLQGENYQLVRLPYLSQDFSMVVLVPDQGAFEAVESGLDVEVFGEYFEGLHGVPLDLKMPKFDFESTMNASDPLKKLGMKVPFDPELADFSAISQVLDLFISDVLHKATITVDEKGTEAAAATAVIMGVTSAPIEGPILLVIDRPFLFFIHHQPTNTILFMGRVLAP